MGRKASARRRSLEAFLAGKRTRRAHSKAAGLMKLRNEVTQTAQRQQQRRQHAAQHARARVAKAEARLMGRRPLQPAAISRAMALEDGDNDDNDDNSSSNSSNNDNDNDEADDDEQEDEDGSVGDDQDVDDGGDDVDTTAALNTTAALKAASADTQLLGYYDATKDILLVGEGNLSFAVALLFIFGGRAPKLTASVFDSEEVLTQKYADASRNAQRLSAGETRVLYNVDGTKLHQNKRLGGRTYDTIAFHFPHVGAGIKDQERNIETNRNMLTGFFGSAKTVLRPHGLIHVTLRRGKPYDDWKIPFLARACGLELLNAVRFDPHAFPGYAHRRTLGTVEGISATDNEEILDKLCVTYVFGHAEAVTQAKALVAKRHGKQRRVKGDNVNHRHDDDDDD